jgi:hypothetical protein
MLEFLVIRPSANIQTLVPKMSGFCRNRTASCFISPRRRQLVGQSLHPITGDSVVVLGVVTP